MKLNYFYLLLIKPTSMRLTITMYLLIGSINAFSQYFSRLDIPVKLGPLETELSYPWFGGMASPQISSFSKAGKLHYYIHDRAGAVHRIFSYETVNGDKKLVWQEGLTKYFPKSRECGLLRDYNGDMIPDLFSYSINPAVDGITVFKGKYVNDTLHFDQLSFTGYFFSDIIPFKSSNGSKSNLFVAFSDVPHIGDMDKDGDLDVATFDSGGGFINYYKNLSVEKGFAKDSLDFILFDQCWGKVFEDLNSKFILSNNPSLCSPNAAGKNEVRHAGGTILLFDEDKDGDLDGLAGDTNLQYLSLLINTPSPNAFVTATEDQFPASNPINLSTFPAAFYVNSFLNNQATEDLLVAPNIYGTLSEDVKVIQRYNVNLQNPGEYELLDDHYIGDELIDFGSGAHPCLIDVDADGDLDLIAGNFNKFTSISQRVSSLFLFENIGSLSSPMFQLKDSNYLNLKAFNTVSWGFSPVVGDIDSDGDQDLLVGTQEGSMYFFENTAGEGNAIVFANSIYPYNNIDIGQASVPCIFDYNNDGLADLFIGEYNGNLNYFPNQGTIGNPVFLSNPDMAPNVNFTGKVNTKIVNSPQGECAPFVLQSAIGPVLICGSQDRNFIVYEMNSDPTKTWTIITENLGEIKEGERSRMTAGDLNNDGKVELIIGNARGGLGVFINDLYTLTAYQEIEQSLNISIVTNPVKDFIQLKSESELLLNLSIFDPIGRKLIDRVFLTSQHLDVSNLRPGCYFVKLQSGSKFKTLSFIKM